MVTEQDRDIKVSIYNYLLEVLLETSFFFLSVCLVYVSGL
jgi:hypothetical protein